jgi:hypothetical protein
MMDLADLGPCVPWPGAHSPEGYARDGHEYVHRQTYEAKHGPVPRGFELDHLCRNVWCINPDHTEAVTHAVNIFRGRLRNREKTHCPHGHEYSATNTKLKRTHHLGGWARRCKICLKAQRHDRFMRLGR